MQSIISLAITLVEDFGEHVISGQKCENLKNGIREEKPRKVDLGCALQEVGIYANNRIFTTV